MLDAIIPFALAHALLEFGLVYTAPSSQFTRLIIVFGVIICCVVANQSHLVQIIPGGVGNDYVVGFILHTSNFLCLARFSPARAPTKNPHTWALYTIFDARWSIKSSRTTRQTNKHQGTDESLKDAFRDLAWSVGTIYLIQKYPLNVEMDDFTTVPSGFVHRLGEVSTREWIVRAYVMLPGWLVPYCGLLAAHCIAKIVSVLFFASSPRDWPPLYGSIKEAYTVRRFYS